MQPAKSGNTEVFLIILLVLAKVTGRAHQSREMKKAPFACSSSKEGKSLLIASFGELAGVVCHPNYRFSIN